MISHDDVQRTLAQEPMTALFMDRQGRFVEILPVPEKPTPELLVELKQSHAGLALVFRSKGEYTSAELEKWQRDAVLGFEVFESGKLPPGWRHL